MNIQKTSNQEEHVISAVQAMTNAFHAGDIAAVMASYADEATIVFEPGKPVSNRPEQEEMFLQTFSIKPHFTYAGHEVFVNGDVALHLAPWTMSGTAPDGTSIEQSGLSVAVLKRHPGDKWLIVLDDPHGQHAMSGN